MAAFQSGTRAPPPYTSITRNDYNITSHIYTQSSTPSIPSATSTLSTGSNDTSLHNTSSLLFGFLITFLAMFVTFMVLGLGWRAMSDRRRRRQLAAIEEFHERRLQQGIPKLWDVWVKPGEYHWQGIQPLAAGAISPDPLESLSVRTDEGRAPATAVDLMIGRAFSRFGGRITIPGPMPRLPSLRDLDEKKSDEDTVAEINQNGLQVAVLIAMPDLTSDGAGKDCAGGSEIKAAKTEPEGELGQYVLGLAKVPLSRPL